LVMPAGVCNLLTCVLDISCWIRWTSEKADGLFLDKSKNEKGRA